MDKFSNWFWSLVDQIEFKQQYMYNIAVFVSNYIISVFCFTNKNIFDWLYWSIYSNQMLLINQNIAHNYKFTLIVFGIVANHTPYSDPCPPPRSTPYGEGLVPPMPKSVWPILYRGGAHLKKNLSLSFGHNVKICVYVYVSVCVFVLSPLWCHLD